MIGPLTRRLTAVLAATAAGLAVSIFAWIVAPEAFMRGWLVAALYWLAISLGAIPVMMTYHLTGGGWGDASQPAARAAAAALPIALVAFLVPLAFGTGALFHWTAPPDQLPEVVRHKAAYLNLPFFAGRWVLYAAIWLALAWRMDAWRRDAVIHPALSAGGPVLWVFSVSFFGFDWVMSLEPEWYSDVFGLFFGAGLVVPAMAFVLLATCADSVRWDEARASHLQDFANLLLSVCLGWVFFDFSQYLIVWMGNLPHEIGWFLHRSEGAWYAFAWAVLLAFFIVPLVTFLFRRPKRSRRALTGIALLILAGSLLHCAWLVLPAFSGGHLVQIWIVPAAWLAIGGPWLMVFGARFAVLPRRAPLGLEPAGAAQ